MEFKIDKLACRMCLSLGNRFRKVVDCPTVDAYELCHEHIQHFECAGRCWLCFGSGRADIFTIIWRTVRKDTN